MKNSHFATAGILAVFALPGCGGGGSSSPSPPQTYTVGGVVSGLIGSGLVLLDNAGNALTISSNGGFTFPTPVPSGVTYDVTVGTQPTSPPSSLPQSCSVSSGAGTVINSNVSTVDVSCVTNSARFVYLTNGGSNNVSGYSIDNATGALTQLSGSPYSAGTKPVSLTIHPSGKFVYVSNSGQNSISAYAVDGGTGSLTAIAGSPYFVTPYAPTSDWLTPVTIDPSGQRWWETLTPRLPVRDRP